MSSHQQFQQKQDEDRADALSRVGRRTATVPEGAVAAPEAPWDALPALATVDQVADHYQLGRTKAYELCRGPLRPAVIRIGRAIRIRRDVLEQLIEKGGDLR